MIRTQDQIRWYEAWVKLTVFRAMGFVCIDDDDTVQWQTNDLATGMLTRGNDCCLWRWMRNFQMMNEDGQWWAINGLQCGDLRTTSWCGEDRWTSRFWSEKYWTACFNVVNARVSFSSPVLELTSVVTRRCVCTLTKLTLHLKCIALPSLFKSTVNYSLDLDKHRCFFVGMNCISKPLSYVIC